MSLSSILLGKQKTPIDKELDSLFTLPVAKPAIPGPSKSNSDKKRKLDADKETTVDSSSKRVKSAAKASKAASKAEEAAKTNAKAKITEVKKAPKSGKGKVKEKNAEAEDDEDEDDERLEATYLKNQPVLKADAGDKSPDSDAEEDADPTNLVHESVKKSNKKPARTPKIKHVPTKETPELRDQRTIFVGNLPLEVASKKPLNKQLQRHILSFLPTAKIESVRFRSIPFQAPTAKLPTSGDEDGSAKPKTTTPAPKKDLRPHEKERVNIWKSKLDEKDEERLQKDEKRFLNPGQKKRIAFINQEFHSTADTVNAYIVFAHPPNPEGRPANLPPLPPTMDPYQAAQLAAEKCDGILFMERMLRVDLVGKGKGENSNVKTDVALNQAANFGTDPRLSVFVGNLEFASKEEDLRVFFEGIISAERGPPPPSNIDDAEETTEADKIASQKPAAWVTRVRIVRDKDTQLGKGFAYVQFADRECVDELLALEEEKLKFAKRKLRVQRCKSLSGGKQINTSQKKEFAAATAVVVPKGDPALGEKLAGLPKDERKQLKSEDADRVARRLAKKKARMSMKPGVGTKKSSGKDRKRVRSN